jgi:hypothetical protein
LVRDGDDSLARRRYHHAGFRGHGHGAPERAGPAIAGS